MSKIDTQKDRLDNMSTGGHLGSTRFGQTGNDAKDQKPNKNGERGDKARPNDGSR